MPEVNQPKPSAGALPAQAIHTMPSKFFSGQQAPKGGRRIFIILIVVLGMVLVGGGVALFFRASRPDANTNDNTNATVSNSNAANENVNAANVNATVAPTVVTGSLLDAAKKPLAMATLTLPEGALDETVSVAISAFAPTLGAYAADEDFQPIAAVYLLAPQSTALNEEATLSLTYTDAEIADLPFAARESSLTIAVWESDHWTKKTSVVDQSKNTVSLDLSALPDDAIAIVVPLPEGGTNANSNTNSSTITSSLDSDRDGLTNQEETLYGTDAGEEDTDGDTFLDGAEVKALYDPNSTRRLSESSTVKTYTNEAHRYSLLHPTGWAIGSLDGGSIVTFTTITGEFVQVSVQDNTQHESAKDWYRALNPSVNPSALNDVAIGSLTGILGPDGLNVYLADTNAIYQVTYNIGVKDEANFLTTFAMMYTSFRTSIAVTNSNTNTNANSNANANSNTNGNSNTNAP